MTEPRERSLVFRLFKYLPVIIPLVKKARRDPRVARAIATAQRKLRGSGSR